MNYYTSIRRLARQAQAPDPPSSRASTASTTPRQQPGHPRQTPAQTSGANAQDARIGCRWSQKTPWTATLRCGCAKLSLLQRQRARSILHRWSGAGHVTPDFPSRRHGRPHENGFFPIVLMTDGHLCAIPGATRQKATREPCGVCNHLLLSDRWPGGGRGRAKDLSVQITCSVEGHQTPSHAHRGQGSQCRRVTRRRSLRAHGSQSLYRADNVVKISGSRQMY